MNVLKSTSALISSLKPKTFRKKHRSPKKRLSTIKSHSASKSKSLRSASHSGSYEHRLSGSPMRRITAANKNITKRYKKLGIDDRSVSMLAKKVNSLDKATKSTFARTKKNRSTSSPLVITVKNIDTGKKQEATIVKNLDTGKYEFLNI